MKKEIIRFVCENVVNNMLASMKLQLRQKGVEEKDQSHKSPSKSSYLKSGSSIFAWLT